MNENHVGIVVGVPVVLMLALVAGRTLARQVQLPVPSQISKVSHETVFEWAVHFAVGSMLLGILTVLALMAVDRPHPIVGVFSGIIAALGAYAIARPPIREHARNPELDGPLFSVSAGVHVVLGVTLAIVLVGVEF